MVAVVMHPAEVASEIAAGLSGYSIDAKRIAAVWARASINHGIDAQDAIRAAVSTAKNFYPPLDDEGDCA